VMWFEADRPDIGSAALGVALHLTAR
jgi:hypothetical protein